MTADEHFIDRRALLLGAAATGALAACSSRSQKSAATTSTPTSTSTTTTEPVATTAQPAPTFVSSGPSTPQAVALTFHVNGDRTLASRLLDLLHERSVVITAFMVGAFIDANPDLVPTFLERGHELANHTYNHLTFASLSRDEMTSEVVRCRDALVRVTGSPARFFRTSGTSDGTTTPSVQEMEVAGAAGYRVVAGFDVDPADYSDPGATAVASRTASAVGAGSIVSLHFGHQGTIDALPVILDDLNRRGLRPVTLSQLLPA
jgi:peptidoglycan/xylan/chitin deacetylase (PgdA/CDA1 family)